LKRLDGFGRNALAIGHGGASPRLPVKAEKLVQQAGTFKR
jgi:hypothetical protein